MRSFTIHLVTLFWGFLFFKISYGQDITGIWRGYFISANSSQYKFEVQIDQSAGNMLNGVTYSYLDTSFYGKAVFTGYFSAATDTALVQEIKTVEVKMSGGSDVCIMKCSMVYVRSGREEFLEGTFTSAFETNGLGHKKGDDCGGGRVYLRKVKTSDFYIEPSLRAKIEKQNNNNTKPADATAKNNTAITRPLQNKPATNRNNQPASNNSTAKSNINRPTTEPAAKAEEKKPLPTDEKKIIPKTVIPTPPDLKSRTNELVQTITVTTHEVTVSLYDNGEIDDDTISVYLDKRLMLSKKRLTAAPLTIKIKMDAENPEHELVMVAENLGRIPPNTSLMIVNAGDKRYEVRITSTEQKNAVVRFRYVSPDKP